MVIGNPKWFSRRKYGGWGLYPKTWQGWIYTLCIILPLIIFHSIPIWSNEVRIGVTVIWIGFILIDTIDIMFHLNLDEREKIHEAIAERNALWVMLTVIVAGMLYQMIVNALNQKFYVDPVLVVALFGALIAKATTNIYLDKKN